MAETWPFFFSLRVMVILGCAMIYSVLAGPFGTLTHMTTVERIALWVPLLALSIVFAWTANSLSQVVFEGKNLLLIEGASVSLTTLTFAPFVWFYTMQFDPDVTTLIGGPLKLWLSVFTVVGVVSVIRHSVMTLKTHADPIEPEPAPRLFQRLPQAMQTPVLRISAKDHRVEVVTQTGITELRLRLSDAVAEMEPIEGFMAHRSHWVAKNAVLEAYRNTNNKTYLKLSNGDLVPVSRTFKPAWEDAGVLTDCALDDVTAKDDATPEALEPRAEQDLSVPPQPPRA